MKVIEVNNSKRNSKHETHYAYVDDEDYELVSKYTWSLWFPKTSKNSKYAVTSIRMPNKKYRQIRMHRMILGEDSSRIDHIDGNGLNNCKSNLRLCNTGQNRMNAKKHKNCTSIYKGVCFKPKNNKTNPWEVSIGVNKRRIHLGQYPTEEEAALVYNDAAVKYFGEFARVNLI